MAGVGCVKRSPLRRVSGAHRARTNEWRKVTRQRAESVEYRCEAGIFDLCDGYGAHGHHVVRRSQGGANVIDNCRWVCRACHRYLHDHPAWAERVGLLKSATASGSSAFPPRAEETTCEPPVGASSAALAVAAPCTPGGIPIVYTSDPDGWAAERGLPVWDSMRRRTP